MRSILGFCAVLAVANLTGTVERAYAFQAPAAGRPAPPPPPAPAAAATAENAVQQDLLPGATTPTTVTTPANANQVPATPRTITTPPGTVSATPGATTMAPANAIQTPGAPGTVTTNPSAVTTTSPGYVAPGTVNAGALNSRTYSSYYVPGTQPGMTPGAGAVGVPGMGSNTVNPMGTTMAPGTYSSGAGLRPYGTPTTTYSSMYVTPGYYTTPTPTYVTRPRRGLFGGLFRRGNRQVYTTAPYTYTYGTAPGTYTYAPAPY
jgi:hypothetical protein